MVPIIGLKGNPQAGAVPATVNADDRRPSHYSKDYGKAQAGRMKR